MSTRLAVVLAALVVAVGLGVGLGVGLSGSGTSPGTGVDRSELAAVRTACEQWLGDTPTEPGTARWCADMTQWMSTRLDHDGVGPPMMWGDPGSLARSCDRWLRTSPPPGAPADRASWCESMVSWMGANMERWSGQGSWGDWMRSGTMMGGFGSPSGYVGPGAMMGS